MSFDSILYRPSDIRDQIEASSSRYTNGIDIILLDFSANPPERIREHVMLHSVTAIGNIASRSLCSKFIILLPKLIDQTDDLILPAAAQLIQSMKVSEYSVILLGGNAKKVVQASPVYDPGQIETDYQELVSKLYGQHTEVIEANLLRRLGHFEGKRTREEGPRCRRYSFTLENCHKALLEAIEAWWCTNAQDASTIIYDTECNPWLEETVLTFAEVKKLGVSPMSAIFSPKTLSRLAGVKCALFVDVVDTGETLSRHIRALRKQKIQLCDHALAVIAAIEQRDFKQKGERFVVTSLVQVEQQSIKKGRCEQCRLNIPFSLDVKETPTPISSYDFWWMVEDAGWEPEPSQEVPQHGRSYEIVPRFPKLLEKYGDWLAQKMQLRLESGKPPSTFFFIHPDEASSNALSERLRGRYQNEVAIVRIPRHTISEVVANGGEWPKVLEESKEEMWFKHLEIIQRSGTVKEGIIIDIFNASGRTFSALHSLLKAYDFKTFCYFPFVDRDPRPNPKRYMVAKYCLYEWYGPRELRH
jgi:adenine/guanine phosphoribosyltransferase-like PRPP-binding protein